MRIRHMNLYQLLRRFEWELIQNQKDLLSSGGGCLMLDIAKKYTPKDFDHICSVIADASNWRELEQEIKNYKFDSLFSDSMTLEEAMKNCLESLFYSRGHDWIKAKKREVA